MWKDAAYLAGLVAVERLLWTVSRRPGRLDCVVPLVPAEFNTTTNLLADSAVAERRFP